ncbi:MAG: LysR family transcriptional regulator [Myxococcota bacterium]
MNRLPPVAWLGSFEAVAREGSFRGAARVLGVTPSAVSHGVRSLEDGLGTRLFQRSTRSVRLTPEGAELLAVAGPALEDLRGAMEALSAAHGAVKGKLRLSAPRAAARSVVMPYVAELLARHPEAQVELDVDDAVVDLVAGGFDAGIRFLEKASGEMVARPIGPRQRFVVVASPSYLDEFPEPRHPEDLKTHRCILQVFPGGRRYRWEFEKGAIRFELDLAGPLEVSDIDTALAAALSGVGVAYVDAVRAAPHIEAGQLLTVLDAWRPEESGYVLVYPSRKLVRPVLRALIAIIEADSRWT